MALSEANTKESDGMSKMANAEKALPGYSTYEERRTLGDAIVMLDGKRARITGFRLPFAQIQGGGESVEFSWETVAHIVTNSGGEFYSDFDKARKGRTARNKATKKGAK